VRRGKAPVGIMRITDGPDGALERHAPWLGPRWLRAKPAKHAAPTPEGEREFIPVG
jgi:hypothetical protein